MTIVLSELRIRKPCFPPEIGNQYKDKNIWHPTLISFIIILYLIIMNTYFYRILPFEKHFHIYKSLLTALLYNVFYQFYTKIYPQNQLAINLLFFHII